jgi:hypothetical protein
MLAGKVHVPLALRLVSRNRCILPDEPARVTRLNVRVGLSVSESRLPVKPTRDAGPNFIELFEKASHVPLDGGRILYARVRLLRRIDERRICAGEPFDQTGAPVLPERKVDRILESR